MGRNLWAETKKCCSAASHTVASHSMSRQKKAACAATTQRFGEWLRGLRESKQLPLRVVAAAAEMDQAHLSKVELGQRLLTGEQASAIAKFFEIDPNEIEARRIVERFRLEHADNPAAGQAINMLHEDPPIYGGKK
jgi:HTH-type transcriptional regulator, competence development regulator